VLRFYRSHEARARRNLQQINYDVVGANNNNNNNNIGGGVNGGSGSGGGFGELDESGYVNTVRPSLSDSANRKRSLA
jgi:hypothetical protein